MKYLLKKLMFRVCIIHNSIYDLKISDYPHEKFKYMGP